MSSVVIEKFKNEDATEVIKLVESAFESKFKSLVDLPKDKIIDLLLETWELSEENPEEGHFVAKYNGEVAGVILLKYQNQKNKKKSGSNSFFKLAKKYGIKNTIKFMIGMELFSHKLTDKECYIEHVAVNSKFRGKGIGTLLIDRGREFAKSIPNVDEYTLSVVESNQEAYKLYMKLGFRADAGMKKSSVMLDRFVGEKEWIFMRQSI